MGIETAIIGSAILGAGASVAGAKKASSAQQQATQAQTQAANQQEQLSREIYYDQRRLFQPFYQAGLQGLYGDRGLMALLGMGGRGDDGRAQVPQNAFANQSLMFDPMTGRPLTQSFGGMSPMNTNAFYSMGQGGMGMPGGPGLNQPQMGPDWQAYLQQNPDVMQYVNANPRALREFGGDINRLAEFHYNTFGRNEGRALPQFQPMGVPEPTVGSSPVSMQPIVDTGGGAYRPGGDDGPQSLQVGPEAPAAAPAGPVEAPVGPMTATLRDTPGYQFLQDEQKKALENSFAARGKLLSGAAMKALQERSMGLADQTYQQTVNNAMGLANLGSGAGGSIMQAGMNYGNMAGNAFGNMANAQAAGAIGRADAWNQGAQGVAGSIMGGLGMYGGYKGWGGNRSKSATKAGGSF
jgi:hypothetical protein